MNAPPRRRRSSSTSAATTRSSAGRSRRVGRLQAPLALPPQADDRFEAHPPASPRPRLSAAGWPVITYGRSPGRTMPSARASRAIVAGSRSACCSAVSRRFSAARRWTIASCCSACERVESSDRPWLAYERHHHREHDEQRHPAEPVPADPDLAGAQTEAERAMARWGGRAAAGGGCGGRRGHPVCPSFDARELLPAATGRCIGADQARNARRPGYSASPPSASSIRSSWLYFATRSLRVHHSLAGAVEHAAYLGQLFGRGVRFPAARSYLMDISRQLRVRALQAGVTT